MPDEFGKYIPLEEVEKTSQEIPQSNDYQILTDPEFRDNLAQRVDKLVEKTEAEDIHNLVFLDKSARPLVTLFLELWRKRFPDKHHPKISFINIGKEIIHEEREIGAGFEPGGSFLPQVVEKEISPEAIEEVKQKYSHLRATDENKKVLIVEEYTSSGLSINKAKQVLGEMFEGVEFEGFSIANFEDDIFDNGKVPWSDKQEIYFGNNTSLTGVTDADEYFSGETLIAKPMVTFIREMNDEITTSKNTIEEKLPGWKQHLEDLFEQLSPYSKFSEMNITESIASGTTFSFAEAEEICSNFFESQMRRRLIDLRNGIKWFLNITPTEVEASYDEQGQPAHHSRMQKEIEFSIGRFRAYINYNPRSLSDFPPEKDDEVDVVVENYFKVFNEKVWPIIQDIIDIFWEIKKLMKKVRDCEEQLSRAKPAQEKAQILRKEMKMIADDYLQNKTEPAE